MVALLVSIFYSMPAHNIYIIIMYVKVALGSDIVDQSNVET